LDIVVLIPSLNPDSSIFRLIQNLKKLNLNNIVIVNDGSNASCSAIFDELKISYGCTVISCDKNEGKGAALKTGIAAIKNIYPDAAGIITADADGQHSPDDILHISEVLKENLSSLILGARDFNKTNLPPKSRYGNKITSAVFFLVTGRHCKDTQTGLRGIPMFLADELLKINGKRFEYETNVLITLAKNKINFIEIPINTIYKNNNRETHFRPVKDSVLIYAQIIKFALSSLLSFVLDISLFSLFHAIVFISFADNIIYSTVAARILSGILNYNINKKAVFGVSGKSLKYFFRYASLFLILMFLSSISVKALANISRAHVTFIKIAVDTILFIFSFIIQKVLVFKNIKK